MESHNAIRKFWDKFGVYAGIIGLIVDCITLWGYIGVKEKVNVFWKYNEFNILGFLPFVNNLSPNTQRLFLIVSAAAIIFSLFVLMIFLPRNGFDHLSDYNTFNVGHLEPAKTDRPGMRYKYGIGIYSLLLNITVISPVIVLWSRAFLFFPLDNQFFMVVFSSLILLSIYLLFVSNMKITDDSEYYKKWLAILAEILVFFIIIYGFTTWSLQYSFVFGLATILATFLFIALLSFLKGKLVLFNLYYDVYFSIKDWLHLQIYAHEKMIEMSGGEIDKEKMDELRKIADSIDDAG